MFTVDNRVVWKGKYPGTITNIIGSFVKVRFDHGLELNISMSSEALVQLA